MIKEYFTDGLIGLAILLSLFRTDIFDLNINNLINYPEVQDIIQGQTAVSLPANFHSNSISAFSPHPKLGDREAFSVWYRNLLNSPHFRQNTVNEIETFLVSGSQVPAVDPSFVNNQTPINITNLHSNESVAEISSQALPQESANSFSESVDSTDGNNTATTSSSTTDQPLSVDVTFLFNDNPFPGCNLTSEDLNLIELLWKQDVDLGVGKEVYDQSLREELERQRQLDCYNQQEKLKAQVAAREKEERSKQEEASRWLKQNFMRDGETGEWVKLQNKTSSSKTNGSSGLATVEEDVNDDSLTLEAALDYISSSLDFSPEMNQVALSDNLTSFQTGSLVDANGGHSVQPSSLPSESLSTPQLPDLFSSTNNTSFENEWTEVEEYLNISLSAPTESQNSTKMGVEMNNSLDMDLPCIIDNTNAFTSDDLPLLQDAALPTIEMEGVHELGAATLSNSSSLPPQPCSLDWEMDNMTFFGNLTALPEDGVDDLDLQNMEGLFNTMTEASDLTAIPDTTNLNQLMSDSSASLNGTSFTQELGDAFDGLEGATGGANYSTHTNLNAAPYKKISRLSESSSSDSGYSGKGGFSSSSSSPPSSYAGSPGHSSLTNSTNSNDTEDDPAGTQALAHQVAHNHTYNTLPGHVPREVKKYAPKETSRKGPQCRDEKRAKELKVPFTVEQIVDSPVEAFNDMLTKYSLNEDQLTLIRDIRRRGKNKLAAQNCRKRKVGVIVTLSDDMVDLQKVRDRLREERAEMERETLRMKEKFGHLYTHIFQSLRDEHGQPYDPNLYSLQQSSDGNVFLVPRNVSTGLNGNGHGASGGSTTGAGRMKKRRSDN